MAPLTNARHCKEVMSAMMRLLTVQCQFTASALSVTMKHTEGDPRIAQSVDDLPSDKRCNILCSGAHGISDGVESDGKKQGMRTRPHVGNLYVSFV